METTPPRSLRSTLWPLGVGVAYGLCARVWFGFEGPGGVFGDVFTIMTITFIFVVPAVIGFLTVYLMDDVPSWGRSLVVPWVPALLTIGGAVLLAWEGIICAVVWAPVALLLASVGGVIARAARGSGQRRPLVLVSVAVLPVVLAPIESRAPDPVRTRTVADRIEIVADADAVWAEIREVAPIRPSELGGSLAYRLGFPRPIEARLEGEGVGAVRYATFEGGVTFVERVTEWDEGRSLAFTIDASAIPSTTFDQHVAVGGRYFDVLTGRYWIEPAGPGRVVLHLTSEQRLATRFNGYTRLWTDRFMGDIQETILRVIRDRAERAA